MKLIAVLEGGAFDGLEHHLTAPARHIDVQRAAVDPEKVIPLARYFLTGDLDRGGRLIYRYEAP